jgi:hypothetical protein
MPAADAGLITLLECVLAPLWVWLAFAETPEGRTVGGDRGAWSGRSRRDTGAEGELIALALA